MESLRYAEVTIKFLIYYQGILDPKLEKLVLF